MNGADGERGPPDNIPGKRAKPELVGLFLFCLLLSIFVSFQKTQQILEHADVGLHKEKHAQELPIRQVGTEPLEHEVMFWSTIKSCLPESNKHCKLFIPDNTTTQRVAVIAPPGDMANAFHRLLELVVARAPRKKKVDIALIPTTHIPPYGYGKTHGWTKIIRIVPQPLLIGTTNALLTAMDVGEPIDSVTVDDIKAGFRQQIRYHCRLSHVAAHTALWSINLETLVAMSVDDLIRQIQVFLDLDHETMSGDPNDNEGRILPDDFDTQQNFEEIFFAMASRGASLLTHAQIGIAQSMLKELDKVLLDEMRKSKNLTAWPCESFWTVGDPSNDDLKFSNLISRISKSMSPDCKAPFTSCFVKRDQCEFVGDGKCPGK